MSEPIDALSERISRLELTNLWLKCTVAAIGLALVAAVVVSFSSTGATEAVPEPPDALDAKQLVIRDVSGRPDTCGDACGRRWAWSRVL